MRILAALLVMLAAGSAWAEEVVLGLSRDQVAITADFDGSELLIFGAVKRETPIPAGEPLQVVATVAGPSLPATVYRKERIAGIWANADAVEIDAAPSFYAVLTSAPWSDALLDTEDLRHRVSIPRAIRSVGAPMEVADAPSFTEALIRIRMRQGLYQLLEEAVEVSEQTLFRMSLRMPANLTEGAYDVRILLTRSGTVVAEYQSTIDVRKVGLERWLYTLSREQPLAYGLLSLAIAIFAGWGASAAFRALRQG